MEEYKYAGKLRKVKKKKKRKKDDHEKKRRRNMEEKKAKKLSIKSNEDICRTEVDKKRNRKL